MKQATKDTMSRWLLALVLALAPALAHAIVTVLDPGGQPVTNKTVTLTLPGQEPQEAETDDEGILFWLDGSKVDELPPGTVIGDGYTFTTSSGWTTGEIIGVGLGVAAGIAVIAEVTDDDDNDNNGGSGSDEPSGPTDPTDPMQPGPAMLGVSPSELSVSREVGSEPCPATIGTFQVSNTAASGSASLDWSASVDNNNLSLSPTSGTVAAGGAAQTVTARFQCSPDEEGTVTGTATIDGGSAGTEMVNLVVNNSAPDEEPGELTNVGPDSFVLVHVIGGSSCPDPYGVIRIQNTGGTALMWSLANLPPFVQVSGSAPDSGDLAPGEMVEIPIEFPCSGFNVGSNNGSVQITSENGGSVSIPIQLTVNNS